MARIWTWNYNPPLHQWARKLGLKLRPPFYVPFARNLPMRFLEMFVLFFPIISLLSMNRVDSSLSTLLFESLVASSFYAVVMCSYYYWTFKRCELTDWKKL
ncbi:DUF6404 family protein [Vibrio parahaemolyticus]|nr:DUF6404 family protein [Vibrio parahaemolyticus]MCX8819441.1 DUF6404 family protein [Vibrio parahaemolyticus]MCX8915668.1 DUF6404 family protein [Vibrio parahaemolyticus]